MTVVENTIPVSSDTPRVMVLTSDTGLPVEKIICLIIRRYTAESKRKNNKLFYLQLMKNG